MCRRRLVVQNSVNKQLLQKWLLCEGCWRFVQSAVFPMMMTYWPKVINGTFHKGLGTLCMCFELSSWLAWVFNLDFFLLRNFYFICTCRYCRHEAVFKSLAVNHYIGTNMNQKKTDRFLTSNFLSFFFFLLMVVDYRFQCPCRPGYGIWFDESRICESRPAIRYIPNNNWSSKIWGEMGRSVWKFSID